MKPYILLLAALGFGAHAQMVEPGAYGDLQRASQFYEAGNYQAALAQLTKSDVPADVAPQILLLKAKTLYALGNYSEAKLDFEALAASYPTSSEALPAVLGAADCIYAQGRYKEALEAYNALPLKRFAPAEAAGISYNSGVCAYQCGDTDAASRYFAEAAAATSTRSAANFYQGVIAFEKGDYAKARNYFNITNQGAEPGRRAPYYIAQIDFVQGQWAKALTQARQVLRACPADERPEMQRVAGESLIKLGQKTDGLEYLRKYIAECKTPAKSALYLVGVADFENGDYEGAVKNLRPVTESEDPRLAQSAYLFIGQSLMHSGDHDAALMSFDKAMSITNGDKAVEEAAYYNYAVAKFEGASIPFKSSAETFEEFLRRYPSGAYSERVADYLAGGYLADKDYAAAVERIDRIANPSDKLLKTKQQALYALAWNDWQTADYASALANLNKAAQYARLDAATAAEVDLLKAQVLARQGNNKEAASLFRSYLNKAPRTATNKAIASYGLGYALYNTGELSGAKRAFTDAASALEGNAKADSYNRLGNLAQASGDFDAAVSYYEKALHTKAGASDYSAFELAKIRGYQRDYEGKLAALDAFMRDYPNSALLPDALLETTQAQISLGRNADAVETYRKLISQYPSTSQGRRGYLEMAMTLLDMNRRADAFEAYRSVISLYPSSEEAAQAATLLKNLYADEGRAADYIDFINSVDNAPKVDAAEAEQLTYASAIKTYRSKGSVAQVEEFVNKYPASSHRAEMLGILLEYAQRNDDTAKAQSLAEQIISSYPDSRVAEDALAVKAAALYSSGSIPEALALYQQLENRASDASAATTARLGVMRAARDMGDYALAAQEADALLAGASGESDYSIAEAQFTKACALEAEGKVDEAIALWNSGAGHPSELFGAKSAYRAAEALYEAGKLKEALAAAQKFVKSGSKQHYWIARGFILLSDIYKAKGNTYESRQYLEALRDNYPGSETDIKMMIQSRLDEK